MPMSAARGEQRQHVDDGARADDERDEAHVAAERAQQRREPPEPRVEPAAVVAAVVVDAHEHAARRAEDGSGCLTLEHRLDDSLIGQTRSRLRP